MTQLKASMISTSMLMVLLSYLTPQPISITEANAQAEVSTNKRGELTPEQQFRYAKVLYDSGQKEKALGIFKTISDEYPQSSVADDALFELIRETLFGDVRTYSWLIDYDLNSKSEIVKRSARITRANELFMKLSAFYPKSEFINKYQGLIRTLNQNRNIEIENARKLFQSAYNQRDVKQLNQLVKEYPDADFVDDALYRIIETNLDSLKTYPRGSIVLFDTLKTAYPNSEYIPLLEKRLKEIKDAVVYPTGDIHVSVWPEQELLDCFNIARQRDYHGQPHPYTEKMNLQFSCIILNLATFNGHSELRYHIAITIEHGERISFSDTKIIEPKSDNRTTLYYSVPFDYSYRPGSLIDLLSVKTEVTVTDMISGKSVVDTAITSVK